MGKHKKQKEKQNSKVIVLDNEVNKIGFFLLLFRFIILLAMPIICLIINGYIKKDYMLVGVGFVLSFIIIASYDELMEA